MNANRGRITLAEGQWRARVSVRRTDPVTGERRRRDLRLVPGPLSRLRTEAAARTELENRLAALNLAGPALGRRIRFADYAERFKLRCAGLAPNSVARFNSQLRRHLLPALGRVWLDELDQAALQAFIGRLTLAGHAPSSVCSLGRLFIRIVSVARSEGFATAPMDARQLQWPRSQEAPADPRAFDQAEIDRLLGAATGWLRALLGCLGLAGLRVGEGLGLDWAHVDWAAGLLRIRQQASRGRLRTLKSRTSRADLPLHPRLKALLHELWQAQAQPATGLLFAHHGLPRTAEGVARRLRRLLDQLQIPSGGFHAFRHGFCVACWRAGLAAETIRRLMRHSTLTMTLRYSHLQAHDLRAGIEQLAQHTSDAA
ncbi:MAG: tyrosine-type recombinase/integrase [Steroidobacteraceae bacterium]